MTAAFVWSVMCSAPWDNVHATQLSTVPKQSSPGSRPAAELASNHISLVADWLGASPRPCSALSVRHSPTVRRSCQPSAGPIGRPVARSQTTAEARWLAIPTPLIVGLPACSSAAVAASSTSSAITAGSNSTSPGNGLAGWLSRCSTASSVASGRITAARSPVVPTSITSIMTGPRFRLVRTLSNVVAGPGNRRSDRPRRPPTG